MILIGEKLNSSIPTTLDAMQRGDFAILGALIDAQAQNGADYIDINTAMLGAGEAEMLISLSGLCGSRCGIMLDSPEPTLLLETAKKLERTDIILNSITPDRLTSTFSAAVRELGVSVVIMPADGTDIPESADERAKKIASAAEILLVEGVKTDKIYADVLAVAVSSGTSTADTVFDTVRCVKKLVPGIKTLCGVSNISFGLPKRAAINAAFTAGAVFCGLDAAILDVCSVPVMTSLRAALALNGEDEYCAEYISFARTNLL